MILAEQVFQGDLIVTSCLDGKHMEKSLHYKGLAFDCRILPGWLGGGFEALKSVLNPLGFDVVLEHDHLHLEFDQK